MVWISEEQTFPPLPRVPAYLGGTAPRRCRGSRLPPTPPRALLSLTARPGGAARLAVKRGGLFPSSPPAVASAMRWVWLCAEHIAVPDRCSGSAGPGPQSAGPIARGYRSRRAAAAPPRAAGAARGTNRGSQPLLPACLPASAPAPRCAGAASTALLPPSNSNTPRVAPQSAAWKLRCSAGCMGKG